MTFMLGPIGLLFYFAIQVLAKKAVRKTRHECLPRSHGELR